MIENYLPKYSADDETIGDEFACGRIVGLSPSCKRSGHELRRHIRRIPWKRKIDGGGWHKV